MDAFNQGLQRGYNSVLDSVNSPSNAGADPTRPAKNASRSVREQYARDVQTRFQGWLAGNDPASTIDPQSVTAQWMYESKWETSSLSEFNNLGGMKINGTWAKYDSLGGFFQSYMDRIYNNTARYGAAQGLSGEAYINALVDAHYVTGPGAADYTKQVMRIYNQLYGN